MASLKDMRVRIAATKATQKITKAMQMVAASKLRRATAAAEASRPYAERMEKVLGNIAASVRDNPSAPRLLAGTGSDQVHLLLVCTGERGLCGPFNSAIVRLPRERAAALLADGKEVQFFCVGRKGYDQLKRQYESRIVETVDLRAVRQIAFENADTIGRNIVARFNAGQRPILNRRKHRVNRAPRDPIIHIRQFQRPDRPSFEFNAGRAATIQRMLGVLLPRALARISKMQNAGVDIEKTRQ